jgi:hypothetical protein
VVIAVLLTTIATFGAVNDDPEPATTTTTTPSTEDLGPAAQQLVALLEEARDETYHARFEGSSPEAPDDVIRLETWQRPPLVRQDSSLSVGGQLARTSSFVLEDGGRRCTQVGDAPWSCRPAAEGELRADVISGTVLQRLQESDVRVRNTKIDGIDALCFTLTAPEGSSELCLDEQGITLNVRSSGSELKRVELTRDFEDSVFDPPA